MSLICGVDEAGRGPLAGPVVAAAVILDHDHEIIGLDDSKKISKPRREKLFYDIIDNADIGIGITSHRIIDKINILEATYRSMRISIHALKNKPSKALIDGFDIPEIDIKNEGIIGGDGKVESISAASIIAKVVRDKFMEMVDPIFPEYEFSKHKGYGTKKHIEILKKIGASEIHGLNGVGYGLLATKICAARHQRSRAETKKMPLPFPLKKFKVTKDSWG